MREYFSEWAFMLGYWINETCVMHNVRCWAGNLGAKLIYWSQGYRPELGYKFRLTIQLVKSES